MPPCLAPLPLFIIVHVVVQLNLYFYFWPQDGSDRQSTGAIMVLGPGIASLIFWALKSLFIGNSCTKTHQWALYFMWPCTVLVLGGCIHNEGEFNGVALQPEPVLGPKQARAAGQPH